MMRYIELKNGVSVPILGLGTFKIMEYDSVYSSLDVALGTGYRLIDTAQLYQNEAQIGRALKELLPKHNLKRSDIFITSKLHVQNMSKEKVGLSVEQTLMDLGTEYVDLFLIHYPKPGWLDDKDPKGKDARKETWLEMEKLHAEGTLRSIGVSSYELRHLDEMVNYASVQPVLNQCEFHPHYCRRDLVDGIIKRGVHFQAFTSLGKNNPNLFSEPYLVGLAEKYNVPVSHILLAWPMAMGISVLPKSSNPNRIKDNYQALHVKLTNEEVEKIWGLHKHTVYSPTQPWNVL